jgi:hypothetical protein
MNVSILVILGAALIPMVMGFIWYNPKVFGNVWKTAAGMTEEKMKGANMGLIFGLAFLLSFLLAFSMQFIVIHQWGVFSTLATDPKALMDPTSEIGMFFKSFMEKYGTNFRTFKHGALHGVLAGFTLALPILGTNALFERKSFKYVAINVGYWMITMALMGGVICAFA